MYVTLSVIVCISECIYTYVSVSVSVCIRERERKISRSCRKEETRIEMIRCLKWKEDKSLNRRHTSLFTSLLLVTPSQREGLDG